MFGGLLRPYVPHHASAKCALSGQCCCCSSWARLIAQWRKLPNALTNRRKSSLKKARARWSALCGVAGRSDRDAVSKSSAPSPKKSAARQAGSAPPLKLEWIDGNGDLAVRRLLDRKGDLFRSLGRADSRRYCAAACERSLVLARRG